MIQIWLYAVLLLSLVYFLRRNNLLLAKNKHKRIPPSPPCLPIIGHLHLLTKKPPLLHRTFQQLCSQYGSIYSLKLGALPVVVIASPAAVKECFTKHDIILANRPRVLVGKHLHYNCTTIGTAPYAPLWLNLRRLTNLELFSNTRMNSFASIRAEEVRSLVKYLFVKSKDNFTKVEMSSCFTNFTFNILTRMLIGRKYISKEFDNNSNNNSNNNNDEGARFIGIMKEVFELNGVLTMVDVFPFLGWFHDERRMVAARKKMDIILDGLLEKCRTNKNGRESTLIYKLLNLQDSSEAYNYPNDIIKGIITVMLTAGTDTSTSTIIWALSLLLNHPSVLLKAREEIDSYKVNGELVEEVDIPKLVYIQCIINETLRLFPAAPLLVGHVPSEDITVLGYHIDKGNVCMINAWAIHRDPNLWEDPLKFKPERFQNLKEDYKYTFIPFGLGRRSCPGASLANKVIGLTLATLIQCFDWKTIKSNEVDLTENMGLTMTKAKPLEAMCRTREKMINVLSKI